MNEQAAPWVSGRHMSSVVDEVSRSELALLVRQFLLDDFPATARTFAAEAAALLQHAPTPGPQQHVKGLHAIVNEYVGLRERARQRESFSRTFGDSALARSCLGKIELLLDDYTAATGPREAGPREAGHRTHAHADSAAAAAAAAAGSIAVATATTRLPAEAPVAPVVPATRGDAAPPRSDVLALPPAASHTAQGHGSTEGQGPRRSRKSVQPRRHAVSHVRVSHVDSRQLFGARASSFGKGAATLGKGARGSTSASAGRATSAGTGRGAGVHEAGARSPGLAELLGASCGALGEGGEGLEGDALQGDGLQIAERIAQTINSINSSMQPADLGQPGGALPPALSGGGCLSVEQIVETLLADPGSLAMLALEPCAGSPPLPSQPPPPQRQGSGELSAPPRPASPPRSPCSRPPPLPPHALGALAPPPLRSDPAPGLARGAAPATPQLPPPAAPRAAPYQAMTQVQGLVAKRSTARKPSAPKATKAHAGPPNAGPVGGRDGRAAAPALVPSASKRPRADG